MPIGWDAAASAISRVTYSVAIDDQDVADGLRGTSYTILQKDLDEGTHTVSVIATDGAGQPTSGASSDVLVDRTAPRVSFSVRGRTLTVVAKDAAHRSGVAGSRTQIRFGDGKQAKGKAKVRHRFRKAGRYRVTVRTADKAGNAGTTRKTVRIR